MKCTVDLIDLVGLSVVMSRIAGKGHTKVLIAGLGWAGAELVFSRLLVLWVGARGTEFDWKYIQKSFEANISIVSKYLINITHRLKKKLYIYTQDNLSLNLSKTECIYFMWINVVYINLKLNK